MTPIEMLVLLLLLLRGVPDLCSRLGRPGLIYVVFLLIGLGMAPFLNPDVALLIREVGRIGFVLLLFEVGLDIELPQLREWHTPLKLVFKWNLVQYPLTVAAAHLAGLDWKEGVLAAFALNAASVGMAFPAWFSYSAPKPENKKHLLLWMVSLEIVGILALTAGGIALKKGFGRELAVQIGVILFVVVAIGLAANVLARVAGRFIQDAARWKVHYIILFVLLVAAVGDRLGLSAPKTAFFLGLFISRATHEGLALSHHLRPIGQNLLIPVFFLSLGAVVPVRALVEPVALHAGVTALVLLGVRDLLHRTIVRSGCARNAFLLVCPNLSMVAIAATAILDSGADSSRVTWLVLTGLFLSVTSLALLPRSRIPLP